MATGLFHRPTGMTAAEKAAGSIREFDGTGSTELRVPGLKKVTSVKIGTTNIPLEQDYKFPSNAEFAQKVHTTLPHVALEEGADGVAVLMRSIHSNDGVWQAGHKVYVGGEWDDEVSPSSGAAIARADADKAGAPSPNQPSTEADEALKPVIAELLALSGPQLKARAKDMGIPDFDQMQKPALAAAIARAAADKAGE